MLNAYLIISCILALIFILIALIISLRNARSRLHSLFMGVSISMAVWLVANYLASDSSTPYSTALITNRLVFIFGMCSIYFILIFIRQLLQKKKNIVMQFFGGANYIAIAAGVTPLIVKDVAAEGATYTINFGWFANIYFLILLLDLLTIVYYLTIGSRRVEGGAKAQITTIRYSFLVGLIAIIITNAVLPFVFNIYALTNAGSFASFFLVAGIAYAIAKHKLFDIRSFVFRALVYLMTVATVGFFYSILVYGLGSLLIDVSNITSLQKFLFAVFALLIATTFSPLIKFFNRYTSKIFYRDAYDTQVILDEIGKIIVGSIDLHKIQRESLKVIEGALRPTFMSYLLLDASKRVQFNKLNVENWKHRDSKPLQDALKKVGKQITIYDELEEDDSYLKGVLRREDISLIAPLTTKDEMVGYIVAGPKKSGNLYTSQDKSLMAIAASELAVALQNAQRFEEIQAFNITLQEKVNEATRELKQTNKKLVELDEAKDEFISMASHQLRTPLTSIKGYISMLVEGDLGKLSKAQQQALKEAFTSSQRMVFLISDFLNVSRIKTGKFVIEPKEVDLSQMVTEELVQLREMAESKELKMVYEPPAHFPAVKLDDNKMHQVMMNMVDNAIYYTPNQGTITIQLYVDGKDVVFKVVDTGIGVPKKEQHKLFSKFFRAGNARKARPDGTGLGLFMAQKVVLAQGGSIIFESTEGKGSTFGFRFPLSAIKA